MSELDDQVDMLLNQSGHLSGSPIPAQAGGHGSAPPPSSAMLSQHQQPRSLGDQGHGYDVTPPPAHHQQQPDYGYGQQDYQSPVAGYGGGGGGYGQAEEYTGRSHLSDDGGHSPHRSTSVDDSKIPGYARIQRWAARKQSRMKDLHASKENKLREDCPFQPNRYPATRDLADLTPSDLYEDNKAWGFDDFVDRQTYGRKKREEQQEYERTFWRNEHRWTGEQTIPEPFELTDIASGRKPHVASLRKTYDSVAAGVRQHHGHEASEIEPTTVPSGLFSCKTSQSIMEMSPDRQQRRTTRSVAGVSPTPLTSARSATSQSQGGIVVVTAEERGFSPQVSSRAPTGGMSARGATPPSSYRNKFGVSPKVITPHRQLPL